MPSSPVYEAQLVDGREVSVIEWEQKGRVFREVFVPAPEDSSPAECPDEGIAVGPRPVSRVDEIINLLPLLSLPDDVRQGVIRALRVGA